LLQADNGHKIAHVRTIVGATVKASQRCRQQARTIAIAEKSEQIGVVIVLHQLKRAAAAAAQLMMMSILLFLLLFAGHSRCQLTTLPTSSSSQYANASTSRTQQQQLPAENVLQSFADEDFQSLPFATEEWPSSAASFERPLSKVDLLALKVDHSLMSSLDQWLARYGIKMPQSVLKTIDEMDLCPERASDGMIRKCGCYIVLCADTNLTNIIKSQ